MRVELTTKAKVSIQKIARYIKYKFTQRQANRFVDEIGKTLKLLSSKPYLGHVEGMLANLPREYRSLVVNKLDTIIYYIDNDCIYIVYCWDNRQNPAILSKKI